MSVRAGIQQIAGSLENVPEAESSPATWGDMVERWEEYLEEKSDKWLMFINRKTGDFKPAPYSHRFQQEYTRMQYAKIQDFVRGSLSEYDNPYLVFLTFSTTTLKPNGEPRPPIDHLEELLDPWTNGVYYELNRVMEGDRKRDPWEPRPEWEYLTILEPTTDEGRVPGGYAHAHAALVVDGEVEPERFESVINRHLQECPGARGEAHEFDDAIEVKKAEELGNPGAYLFKYLGKSWDTEDMEDYEKRFAALLYDQERQRLRASNGAQRWMQREEDESEGGDYIFAGVGDGDAVFELMDEYDDLEDFRVANEMGVRAWLNKRPDLDAGLEDEELGAETRRITPEEYHARERAGVPLPWEYQEEPDGDRPPPA